MQIIVATAVTAVTNAKVRHVYYKYRVTQKNGATGHPISLQIFQKLNDRIAWKLMDLCNIICLKCHACGATYSENTATVVYSHCIQIDLIITQ